MNLDETPVGESSLPLKGFPDENLKMNLDLAIRKRNRLLEKLTRLNHEVVSFEANDKRLDLLMKDFQSFEDIEQTIDELNYKLNVSTADDVDANIQFYNIYAQLMNKVKTHSPNSTVPPAQESQFSPLNLPKLNIQPFDGHTISNWNEFQEIYESLIHNNVSLSPIQKFQYLKTLLKGPALNVISAFKFSSDQYVPAYEQLCKRFSNPRRLATHFINQLLDFKQSNKDSYESLCQFSDIHISCRNALDNLELKDLKDFLLLSIACRNLDNKSRLEFETSVDQTKIPTFQNLIDFIANKIRTKETMDTEPYSANVSRSPPNLKSRSFVVKAESPTNAQSHIGVKYNCAFCNCTDHSIYKCQKFCDLPVSNRIESIRQLKLCYACFGPHIRTACTSTKSCRSCNSKEHNSLLHVDKVSKQPESKPDHSVISCHSSAYSNVILGTAIVLIADKFNKWHHARAVIDSGSQITAISKRLADKLHLHPNRSNRNLIGIGSRTSQSCGEVEIHVTSPIQRQFHFNTNAVVLHRITCNLPTISFDKHAFEHVSHLKLADPNFNISSPVDLLLGADVYVDVLSDQHVKVITGKPNALNTKFGFIIIGPTPIQSDRDYSVNTITSLHVSVDTELSENIQRFWQAEEISAKPTIHPEDEYCESLFKTTTTRDVSGRYVVTLPVKPNSEPIGSNRTAAIANFKSLERRLNGNHSSQLILYHSFMQGSSPSESNRNLNQILLSGPKLQKDITQVLISFCLHNIVVCADIKQMYRQVLVRPEDRHLQHIFYRSSPASSITEYSLNTITYGLTSSAYLAQRTLLQLVEDHGKEYPLAAEAILQCTYVDDICCGADSVDQAKMLIHQLNSMLALGHFELRKWSSNNSEAISHLPESHLENPLTFSDPDQSIKVLGFQWNPSMDAFSFVVTSFCDNPSKRTILSYIARMFDPLGLLCPVIFFIKTFIKKLWIANLDWDDSLTNNLHTEWNAFIQHITLLSTLRIPRALPTLTTKYRVLGFCDASSVGYAAVVYLQPVHADDFCMLLLKAKSRVAPVKYVSIPRLELSAAVLLSRLVDSIMSESIGSKVDEICLFTDASIVLFWLKTPAYKLKTYVANRVTQILELTTLSQWRHVRTEDNPADIASRGSTPQHLIENADSWFNGPSTYRTIPENWPSDTITYPDEISELKRESTVLSAVVLEKSYLLSCFEKYSSLKKATRIFAYILRFIACCRFKRQADTLSLSVDEMKKSSLVIVKLTQSFYFADALKLLHSDKSVMPKLAPLSPFLDALGLIRVGGRLRHSSLEYDAKHQLLLPKHCHLSHLLCDETHIDNMHSGPRTTQAIILQNYWIISVRELLRQRIKNCCLCTRFNAKPVQPLMSDLPSYRVNPSPAFSHVGVDFAGPFITKASMIRNAKTYKGYLAVFVCLSSKAVHLEYVSSLSTEDFLAAFDRFISRHGLPSDVYSDNGLNFVGSARHLREIYELFSTSQNAIQQHLLKRQIRWHFNAPHAPNFGGIWEAAVKSAKRLLRTVFGDQPHTFEEFATIFARIEAIMNSRPIIDFSPDPNEELEFLTPGHLLVGRALLQPLEVQHDASESPRTKWDRIRQSIQSFWKKLSNEYLHTQSQRQKWNKAAPSLQIDQLVFMYGLNTPPMEWPIGRITALHPGRDGINRVATVKTATGSYQRPVNRLVPLPMH